MSEQDKQSKSTQEDTGQTGENPQEKSKIDKVIDKAQEKGVTDKAANLLKNKFKSR